MEEQKFFTERVCRMGAAMLYVPVPEEDRDDFTFGSKVQVILMKKIEKDKLLRGNPVDVEGIQDEVEKIAQKEELVVEEAPVEKEEVVISKGKKKKVKEED